MREIRLALIGFGNVAQGLTQILMEQQDAFAQKFGAQFLITAITDTARGSAFHPDGLKPAALLEAARTPDGLRALPGAHPQWDAMEMIQNSPTDVVIEMSVTNLRDGEPATSYIAEALRRKKNVVTTNKGPIALHYDELAGLARLHGVQLGVEGTVMSGTPVLRVGREMLSSAGIQRIQGILNGTSNFILTRMEAGAAYEDALAEAQAQGFAEADPSGDVDGFDAAAKVAILARLVMGAPVAFADVVREGIRGLTQQDVRQAAAEGKRWKLVGQIERQGETVIASVAPCPLPEDHPLARVQGAGNAVLYTTKYLGDVLIAGPGAGRLQTSEAIIQDLCCMYGLRRSC
jgi:homoserine dehydrogenase